MSAAARNHDLVPEEPEHGATAPASQADELASIAGNPAGTEYATRGARAHRSSRPHLRMVSPLRPERASRGVFALVVTGLLGVGMVLILVINTSLAQGAFTVEELKSEQATLLQQEQTLEEAVAAAAAPENVEAQARSLGMVPSENPVFLDVTSGKVLGKPKAAAGRRTSVPRLLTPADATVTEAVDNGGADLPTSPGPDYDPAAVDAAAAQAAAANAAATAADQKAAEEEAAATAKKGGKKAKNPNAENNLWQDSTILDVTELSSEDAGLVAVPVE